LTLIAELPNCPPRRTELIPRRGTRLGNSAIAAGVQAAFSISPNVLVSSLGHALWSSIFSLLLFGGTVGVFQGTVVEAPPDSPPGWLYL